MTAMKGLLVWAHSFCRSTLSFYVALGKAYGVPIRILIWIEGFRNRQEVGFSEREFEGVDYIFVGNDRNRAESELEQYKDYHQLFGIYQQKSLFQTMFMRAKSMGCPIGIASEAPCNMRRGAFQKMAYELYIPTVLWHKVRKHIKSADFIINFSGETSGNLKRIGWRERQIVACGYYSNPLPQSQFVRRTSFSEDKFLILMTGRHEAHRDPMTFVHAIHLLRERGIFCPVVMTQDGPLYGAVRKYSNRFQLGIEFLGRVPYERLVALYESCACFVACGTAEPWGIRLNDALLSGAPLVVSSGMGGAMLVRKFQCGAVFERGNAKMLADALEKLIRDKEYYQQIAHSVEAAAKMCLPEVQAERVVDILSANYPMWAKTSMEAK